MLGVYRPFMDAESERDGRRRGAPHRFTTRTIVTVFVVIPGFRSYSRYLFLSLSVTKTRFSAFLCGENVPDNGTQRIYCVMTSLNANSTSTASIWLRNSMWWTKFLSMWIVKKRYGFSDEFVWKKNSYSCNGQSIKLTSVIIYLQRFHSSSRLEFCIIKCLKSMS